MNNEKDIFGKISNELVYSGYLKSFENEMVYFDQYYRDPIRLLIMGEFSAGKSTIINTLLGRDLAAIGVIATTAVPTYFRFNEREFAEIVYKDGRVVEQSFDQIKHLNSERQSTTKQYREQLEHINVYLNHPILKNLVLIDTPGLNSSNKEHTEHTLATIHHVDDAMWIFQYGHVGRNSEFEQLNDLRKANIHPIGVVNMIDNADDDDLSTYLAYEFQKLDGRIRSILGISAIEAKEAMETNDSELLKLSGFLQFLNTIETIKTQTNLKDAQFKRKLEPVWIKFSAAYQAIFHSEFYADKVAQIETFSKSFKLEYAQLQQTINENIAKEQEHLKSYVQFATIRKNQDFIRWFESADSQLIFTPELYGQMKPLVSTISQYNQQLEHVNEEVRNFNQEVMSKTPGISEFLKRIRYGKGEFHKFRQKRAQLKEEKKKLKQQYKKAKKQVKPLLQLIKENLGIIENGLTVGAQSIQAQIHLQIDSQRQLIELVRNNQQLLERVHFDLAFLENLATYNQQVEKNILKKQLTPNMLFKHTDLMEQISTHFDEEIDKLDFEKPDKLPVMKITGDFVIPKLTKKSGKINFMILRSYRPLAGTMLAVALLGCSFIYSKNTEDNFLEILFSKGAIAEEEQDKENVQEESIEKDEKEEEVIEQQTDMVEEPQKLHYLSPQSLEDGSIGTFEVTRDNFVYPDTTWSSDPVYRIAKGSTWPVFAQEKNWYKIQDDLWVHHQIGNYYERPNAQNTIGDLTNPLAMVTVKDNYTPVYSDGNLHAEVLFDLEAGTYPVYLFERNNMLRLGNNAWIEYTEQFSLQQPNVRLADEGEVIGHVTNYVIPSQLYDQNGDIIGLLTENQTLPIYEHESDALRIGKDVWIGYSNGMEIEMYHSYNLSNYMIYVHEKDTPIYREPNKLSSPVGFLPKARLYRVSQTTRSNEWYEVGTNQWIYNDQTIQLLTIDGFQLGYATVLVKNLNGRVAPSMDAAVETQFQPDQVLGVYGISDDMKWLKISGELWITYNTDYILFEPIND